MILMIFRIFSPNILNTFLIPIFERCIVIIISIISIEKDMVLKNANNSLLWLHTKVWNIHKSKKYRVWTFNESLRKL